MSGSSGDEQLMRVALAEAKKARGQTSPNPAVGAVLALHGRVIASGYHKRAGAAHAEVDCLENVSYPVPAGATLYVTLEPCSTAGRTPPCTEAIIRAGVKRIVIGAIDPNPRHAGRGLDMLRSAGVAVSSGVLADECSALNRAFNKWICSGRPFVIAKCAMTLDGRLTTAPTEGKWITSTATRRHANRRRGVVDAILVGAETVRADNPRLTVREIRGARQPWRVVITRSARLPPSAHVFTDRFADRTLVYRDRPLSEVLDELGTREITSVLIEGGGDVLGQALDSRLIDAVELYFAPMFTGGPVVAFAGSGAALTQDAVRLSNASYEVIGGDIFVTADVLPIHVTDE
jgi:diaminohydroxyphosphoribosylaminopyrimidine deaminase/5-amino-6-(5-phosphoribosylamino)uracil reductase